MGGRSRRIIGRFVAVVSVVVGSSLVWTSGPAQAVDLDPRLITVADAVSWTPAQVINQRMGNLLLRGTTGMTAAEITAASPLLAKIGTPAEVRAGTKLGSRACRTGWGCLGVAVVGAGLLAHATQETWVPWVQGLYEPGMPVPQPQYYASAKVRKCGALANWDPSNSAHFNPSSGQYSATITATGVLSDGIWGCSAKGTWGVDCHKDGVWVHQNIGWTIYLSHNAVGKTGSRSTGFLCGANNTTGWEIRKLHLDQSTAGDTSQNQGLDKGFYWGYETAPTAGAIESVTRCKRPDTSVYDVGTVEPVGSGLVGVPPCNAGDVPIYTETTHIAPDGTRTLQSSNRLDDPTGLGTEMYPDCATAGCQWFVKVNGVQCVKNAAGCTNWAADKQSATCWYGPYELPLVECSFLERAYQPGPAVPASLPNTDGDPITWDGPTPQLTPTSPPTSTPTPTTTTTTEPSPSPTPTSTGNPLPTPTPTPSGDPSPQPTPTPTPTPTPDPSGSASPSPSPSASSSSQPTPTPTPSGNPPLVAACTTSYNLGGGIQPEAVAVANEVGPMFGVDTIYGYADRGSEHSVGLALDFMVGTDSAKGQAITDYLQANQARLGVRWIIWEQHVWNVERASEGWRLMEDRGSPTQNHMDHPHVFLYDRDLPGIPSDASCSGGPTGGADGECFPNGWSWNPIQWVLQPVKCAITWAFVPDGAAVQTDLDELRDAWSNHPPGSLVETVRPVLAGLGSGWDADCIMPDFSPIEGESLRLPCEPPGGNVWTTLYTATQGFLVITTGIYLWGMIAAGVSAKATGA